MASNLIILSILGLLVRSGASMGDHNVSTMEQSPVDICERIQFTNPSANCTSGDKHPILGNCTSYLQCYEQGDGSFLVSCHDGGFFNHEKNECTDGTEDEIENCDQVKCDVGGVEQLKYEQSRHPAEPNGGNQNRNGAYGNRNDGNNDPYHTPRQDEGYDPISTTKGPQETTDHKHDGHIDEASGSLIPSVAIAVLLLSFIASSSVTIF